MNLYYLHFNNYYNRIVKKFDTLSEYLTLPYYDNVVTENIQFNPNDGVDTKQITNVPVGNEFTYDYCVLADGNTIVSRWFILYANRNRNGQYTLTLRRDMFVDSYEPVLDAPAFIEKATLRNNDPMIFNSENMTFNQIKKGETLLKDSTGCPWIVGYLNKGTTISQTSVSYKLPTPYANKSTFESDWSSFVSNGICDNLRYTMQDKIIFDYDFSFVFKLAVGGYIVNSYAREDGSYSRSNIAIQEYNYLRTIESNFTTADNAMIRFSNLIQDNKTDIMSKIRQGYNIGVGISSIMNYNGKILFDESTSKCYKVSITTKTTSDYRYSASKLTPDLISKMNSIISENQYITGNKYWGYTFSNGTFNDDSVRLQLNLSYIEYSLSEVSNETVTYQIANTANTLQDAPYTMFAIPYGACSVKYLESGVEKTITIDDSNGKAIAIAVAFNIIETQSGGSNPALYDIQLLPYCPLQNNVEDDGVINLEISSYYNVITDSSNRVVSLITFPLESRFTFNIPYNINISSPKIESQCDMYRLCSPNWNGQFEFNAAKNGGVATINIDCEYKPFQPYIHLNPNFNILYGQDYNDARGLVCNGDFSLTQTADAWATYQRQNVNYEKIFNRQIQNMEVNNAIQNIQTATQATLGVAGGALGGFLAGGPIGAVWGGTASAVGGAVDYALQKASQAEAIDYTKDQFGYSLGNIKALPDSLTKVSAFNNNNKIFPVMEYYTCTEEEKVALENKLKYNGMTVMRIGTIREFLMSEKSYIKGKLIRLENFNEDFHYVNELANEFNKGVFI